jgi:hypothetical protein
MLDLAVTIILFFEDKSAEANRITQATYPLLLLKTILRKLLFQ